MKFYAQIDKDGNVEMLMKTPLEAELDESQENFSEISEKDYEKMKGKVGKFRVSGGRAIEKIEKKVYDDNEVPRAVLKIGDDK